MFIYFCENCKKFDAFKSKTGSFKCPECGKMYLSLGATIDEWNALSNDEMLALIEKAQKPLIKSPDFSSGVQSATEINQQIIQDGLSKEGVDASTMQSAISNAIGNDEPIFKDENYKKRPSFGNEPIFKDEDKLSEYQKNGSKPSQTLSKKSSCISIIACVIAVIVMVVAVLVSSMDAKKDKYNQILSYEQSGDYDNALKLCDEMLEYEDVYSIRSRIESKKEKEATAKSMKASDSSPSVDNASTTKSSSSGLSHDKKMQVLSYINGIMDPLNSDWSLTDDYLDAKYDEVCEEAEAKFGVTFDDILDITSDYDLIKEYYSGAPAVSGSETITTYDGTLEDNGYGTIVVATTKDALQEYTAAEVKGETNTINELMSSGKIAYEVNGVKVNLRETGLSVVKVKLLDGLNAGSEVYVYAEHLKMK